MKLDVYIHTHIQKHQGAHPRVERDEVLGQHVAQEEQRPFPLPSPLPSVDGDAGVAFAPDAVEERPVERGVGREGKHLFWV